MKCVSANLKNVLMSFGVVFPVLLLGIILTGCGASNTNETDAKKGSPSVEYAPNTSGTNELAKYTNADWLYENYFSEYGLPDELKLQMLPELQMVANGFALQHSLGKDVNANISYFKSQMQMLYATGEIKAATQSMLKKYNKRPEIPKDKNHENPHDGAQCVECHSNYKEYSKAEGDETAEVSPQPADVPRQELILDEEARANVEEAKRLDREDEMKEEQLVIDHHLPYPLPNNGQKYIVVEQGMKGRRRGNSNPPPPPPKKTHNIESWKWKNADIAWTNGGSGGITVGHMALVATDLTQVNDGNPDMIDANTGGVKRWPKLNQWAAEGGPIAS